VSGAIKFLVDMMRGGLRDVHDNARKTALNNKVKNGEIDTCLPSDTEKWETGICVESDKWFIVEQYENEQDAKSGHARWVKKVRRGVTKEELERLNDNSFHEWMGGIDERGV
jgi:hypothetical protein